jgi:hypothetical protein
MDGREPSWRLRPAKEVLAGSKRRDAKIAEDFAENMDELPQDHYRPISNFMNSALFSARFAAPRFAETILMSLATVQGCGSAAGG